MIGTRKELLAARLKLLEAEKELTRRSELRHRNASKRERRRVAAQGDPLQCAEGITR